jgi:hypothetical protein
MTERVVIGDAVLYRGATSRDGASHGWLCSLRLGSPSDCLPCPRSHGEQFRYVLMGVRDAIPSKRDAPAFDGFPRRPLRSELHSRSRRVISHLCSAGDLHLGRLQALAANTRSFSLALFSEIGKERSWPLRSRKHNSTNGLAVSRLGSFPHKTAQQVFQNAGQSNQGFGGFDYCLRYM